MTDTYHETNEWAAQTAAEAGVNIGHVVNALYNPGQDLAWHDPAVAQLMEAAELLIGEGAPGDEALVVKNLGALLGYTSTADLLPPPVGKIEVLNNALFLRSYDFGLRPRVHKDRFSAIRERVDQAVQGIIDILPWHSFAPPTPYDFSVLRDKDDVVVAYRGQRGVPINAHHADAFYDRKYDNPCDEGVDDMFAITVGNETLDIRSGMTRGVYEALLAHDQSIDQGLVMGVCVPATVITGERTPRNGYWIVSHYLEFERVAPYELQSDIPFEANRNVRVGFRPGVVLKGLAELANLNT